MDLPRAVDDYIKQSIDHCLGLPVSNQTLELKLRSSEEVQRRLREQCSVLQSKLKDKDQVIERTKAESTMNAQALKRFVEENQKLADECANLLVQCQKWERECSLYDHDREALMDFGNEADERAKEAEIRVHELEEELRSVMEELQFYKHGFETRGVDSPVDGRTTEESLLDSILVTVMDKDEVIGGHAFLEANSTQEPCLRLLKMWNSLRPSTQKVLLLIAQVQTLKKEKEHLRINLNKAEEEVNVLFEENGILDKENKRLLKQSRRERSLHGSGEKQSCSTSANKNKRKSSPRECSPTEKKIDFTDPESARKPLSPIRFNSPDSRMHKK